MSPKNASAKRSVSRPASSSAAAKASAKKKQPAGAKATPKKTSTRAKPTAKKNGPSPSHRRQNKPVLQDADSQTAPESDDEPQIVYPPDTYEFVQHNQQAEFKVAYVPILEEYANQEYRRPQYIQQEYHQQEGQGTSTGIDYTMRPFEPEEYDSGLLQPVQEGEPFMMEDGEPMDVGAIEEKPIIDEARYGLNFLNVKPEPTENVANPAAPSSTPSSSANHPEPDLIILDDPEPFEPFLPLNGTAYSVKGGYDYLSWNPLDMLNWLNEFLPQEENSALHDEFFKRKIDGKRLFHLLVDKKLFDMLPMTAEQNEAIRSSASATMNAYHAKLALELRNYE